MHRIYLDHAATTPTRDEVRVAMRPYLAREFGNPSSTHARGRAAANALEDAREKVADLLGADPTEIYFTRGGTESDNLAVLGRADAVRQSGRTPFVAVSEVEHRAVLDAADAVAEEGGRAERIPVAPDGTPQPDALYGCLEEDPALVSLMWVNNEVGMRLPVGDVARRCRERGVPFHTDAVQAVGKVPVRVDEVPVDLLTATGHKIYGPKGTGILFVRRGTELRPRLFGGGQERGLRPGTQDVAGAVGMAEALSLAVDELGDESRRLGALRDELQDRLREGIPGLKVHGEEGTRAPHVLNVGIPEVSLDSLLVSLDMGGLAVSSGSACASGASRASHVLRALYGSAAEETAPIRYSLGRETDGEQIARAAALTIRTVERLRSTAGAA